MNLMTRRAHQCHRGGCDSEAVWQMFVKFETRTPAGHKWKLTGKSSITVCDRHQKDAAESFLTTKNLDTFADGLERENLGPPDPNSIQFEFARIRQEPDRIAFQIKPGTTIKFVPAQGAA